MESDEDGRGWKEVVFTLFGMKNYNALIMQPIAINSFYLLLPRRLGRIGCNHLDVVISSKA